MSAARTADSRSATIRVPAHGPPPMTTTPAWHYENFEPTGSAIGFRIVRKLDELQSPFQKIEIYETSDWGNLMLIDGAVMLTARDNFLYHEMMAHPALFTHAAPREVAIIGGGDCGTLREVLRHPGVVHAVQCDIDEQVTRMAEKWFPELCEANADPRARLLFDDGVAFMRDAAPGSLDLVIVDSTDPVGPAEGLFNRAFYASCFRALRDDGILVQQSESPLALLDLIREMRGEMAKAGFGEFATLPFPQPCYPTGWWSCTLARKHGHGFGFREAAARAQEFPTRYYSAGVHHGALATPPFVAEALDG
jgi:spermidine synthase